MTTPIFPRNDDKPAGGHSTAFTVAILAAIIYVAILAGLAWLLSFALSLPYWNSAALIGVAVAVLLLTRRRK